MIKPVLKAFVSNAILALALFAWVAPAQQAIAQEASVEEKVDNDAEALADAMVLVSESDWEKALERASDAGPVARDIIEWHRLRAGNGTIDEVNDFVARNGDWPGLAYLRRQNESGLPFGDRAEDVLAYFAQRPPRTGSGSVNLVAAYEMLGRKDDAEAQVVVAWLTQTMSAQDEALLLGNYGELLEEHHQARLDMLLWNGDRAAAERMYPYVSAGWRALGEARLALRQNKSGVDRLIGAVPKDLREDPGLVFERFQWRARKGMNQRAIDLLASLDGTQAALGKPSRWGGWRRVLARWAMRQGDAQLAYRLASDHGLTSGTSFADLEWLSGYLSLVYLDDPQAALDHFHRFEDAVSTPISLGRAGYWQGRALEAMGQMEAAKSAYGRAAVHQTSFYGQLAAERVGVPMDATLADTRTFPDWRGSDFVGSSVFEAAILLQRAGQRSLAARFMVHLAEAQDETGLGQLADVALELGDPYIAVMIGKAGARKGVVIPKAYYAVMDLDLPETDVPRELALAIARRESEFNPAVVSGAGARGLMQLMPATAREVAGTLGLDYDRARLTEDPVYNATLGTAYLSELIEEFGGNLVMTSAGYNAGPSRPKRWAELYGDPRDAHVNAVDWIESIPFAETRNYVMRVMESLPVYRARLSGETAPWTMVDELQASGADYARAISPRARP